MQYTCHRLYLAAAIGKRLLEFITRKMFSFRSRICSLFSAAAVSIIKARHDSCHIILCCFNCIHLKKAMKTILAPTDFSQAANNACLFAYELAKSFKARLIIYSAYQEVPFVLPGLPVIATPEDIQAFVEQQLKQEAKQLDTYPSIVIDTACSESPSASGIVDIAWKNAADIIVTGMKGNGRDMRKFFDSTVTSLVNKTTVPLVVVPENKKYSGLNTIALANESDVTPYAHAHLLDLVRDMVEMFRAKFYLVPVAKNKMKEEFELFYSPSTIKRLIRDLDSVYACTQGKEVTSGPNEFIKNNKVAMLAMLSHPKSLLVRWLGGSITQR